MKETPSGLDPELDLDSAFPVVGTAVGQEEHACHLSVHKGSVEVEAECPRCLVSSPLLDSPRVVQMEVELVVLEGLAPPSAGREGHRRHVDMLAGERLVALSAGG